MTEMLSGMVLAAKDVDFYIKGLVKYKLFGQELWITTTHVGLFIVSVILIILMIVGHRIIVKADPMAKPFPMAAVVFPTASSLSVIILTS